MNYMYQFIFNIRTAQHSDVEHIVQGNFRVMLFNTKYTKISTIRLYTVPRLSTHAQRYCSG